MCTSSRVMRRPVGLGNRGCHHSLRRCATRSSRRPGSGFAACQSRISCEVRTNLERGIALNEAMRDPSSRAQNPRNLAASRCRPQRRVDDACRRTWRCMMATRAASHHTLYQVSTATALVQGIYQGAVRVGTLREHGDLGLGTFENLDGEMVIVDGQFFQARSDGSVRECDDDVLSPFAVITCFAPAPTVMLDQCTSMSALTRMIV